MHTHTCIHMPAHTSHTCLHTHSCTHIPARTCARIFTLMHIHTCAHMHTLNTNLAHQVALWITTKRSPQVVLKKSICCMIYESIALHSTVSLTNVSIHISWSHAGFYPLTIHLVFNFPLPPHNSLSLQFPPAPSQFTFSWPHTISFSF